MARERSHRSRRRRRGRFGGIYRFLSILAVAAAVIVACVVFFRVEEVLVAGNAHYTAQQIIDASGIVHGDNLIAISRGKVASTIQMELPYVKSVSIRRQLPDGVLITVKERQAAAIIDSSSGRWLISSQGKLLEPDDGRKLTLVTGITAIAPYAGYSVQVTEENERTLNYVEDLLTAMEERAMLGECAEIDCSPATHLLVSWNIYQIKLPRGGDYGNMLRMLSAALEHEEMPKNEPGTFDFTVVEGEVYFRRQR